MRVFGFLLFFAFSANVYAQNARVTISGFLRDSLSNESLIGATVHNKINMAGTSTNQFGFYSLTVPQGEVELVYSFVGYNTQTYSFHLRGDTVMNISLKGSLHLRELEITADRSSRIQETTQMSSISVPMVQIKSLPAFLGEVDLLKALQLMPGIQSGAEGTSGLYVRGGGPDQNLILLDGVPVYNASHLFGFFSVFNADAINSMEIIKGGFPARYGGRVSSVLDVNMKEGNMQKFHGEGAIGIVSAKLTLEGPIIKDRSSFIVSGRRTYLDAFINGLFRNNDPTVQTNEYKQGYYFYDLTAKINYKFSDRDRIYLSSYLGDDKFHSRDKTKRENSLLLQDLMNNTFVEVPSELLRNNASDIKWGNFITAFRWNHIFTNRLFSNTTITYSRYRYTTGMEGESIETFEDILKNPPEIKTNRSYYGMWFVSGIHDWSGKIDFNYIPVPEHYFRFGINTIYHTFTPGVTAFHNTIGDIDEKYEHGANKSHSWEFAAYIEDDIILTDKLKTNIGVHWSAFAVENSFYDVLQPRISVRYLLTPRLSAKGSYSRMAQYIHLLANSTFGMPTDLWVPSTDLLRPQKSDQIALGIAHNYKEDYEVSLEGYYKTMSNVLEYKEGASYFNIDYSWEQKVLQGTGRSYGVELFIQKKTGTFTGWFGYTLSWTDRLFKEINNGKRFPFKYDRRNDLSIALMQRFGKEKRHELSGVWVFGTGNSVTLPQAIYQYGHLFYPVEYITEYYDYGGRNSFRMSAYHRLDLSVAFVKQKKFGERRWIWSIYNVYNRKNPFYADIESVSSSFGENPLRQYKFVQYSLFPIIPSVSYQLKF